MIKPEARFNLVTHDWQHSKQGSVGTPRIVAAVENYGSAEFWFTSTFRAAFERGEYEIQEASDGKFTHIQFYCLDCSPKFSALKRIPYEYNGGTGYATYENEGRRCYECAGKRSISDAKQYGKAMFYLYNAKNGKPLAVGDWAGAFKLPVYNYIRNGKKLIVWFRLDGQTWRGINNGEDDLVRAGKKASF
jgi:hypothetical protein